MVCLVSDSNPEWFGTVKVQVQFKTIIVKYIKYHENVLIIVNKCIKMYN